MLRHVHASWLPGVYEAGRREVEWLGYEHSNARRGMCGFGRSSGSGRVIGCLVVGSALLKDSAFRRALFGAGDELTATMLPCHAANKRRSGDGGNHISPFAVLRFEILFSSSRCYASIWDSGKLRSVQYRTRVRAIGEHRHHFRLSFEKITGLVLTEIAL